MPAKEKNGIVVSDGMNKTVVVSIETTMMHKKYGKITTKTKKYTVHDEKNACKEGDFVTILETRPLSRTKRWALKSIRHSDPTSDTLIFGE